MGSTAEEKACLVGGVIAGADATGLTGILYRGNASASNTILTLPSYTATTGVTVIATQGKWINIYAKSTNVQYAFSTGASGAVLTYDPDVTIGTGLATAGATVPANTVFPVLVPPRAKFLSIISESASGKVEIYVSEQLSGAK